MDFVHIKNLCERTGPLSLMYNFVFLEMDDAKEESPTMNYPDQMFRLTECPLLTLALFLYLYSAGNL